MSRSVFIVERKYLVLKDRSGVAADATGHCQEDGNNRPFYRYGGHIELIRFKEYYRMPRGHEHISFVFSSAFRSPFFKVFLESDCNGKKIFVPCLDIIMIAFFPRNLQ